MSVQSGASAAYTAAAPQLVVGTAGHIDHGKSRLVLALTGTDPDRLPEEKARGMTIDLGFAYSRIDGCDVWFVDVPGHERFIRNMVAGATGVDAALLIVAADDSVMPQTREHVEVLSLLGVQRCLIVLTKLDLVDDEWAAAVQAEAEALLRASGLALGGCVWTSAESGRGIDDLRRALAKLARSSGPAQPSAARWFRLPVDRAFTVAGRGTVVTGSVWHGSVQTHDELELCPAGRRVRVRDLQTHNEATQRSAGRMRLAVNLAGVSLDEVQRGSELATPGYLVATRCVDVQITRLRVPGRQARRALRLRAHLGTSETRAELRWLERPAAPEVRDGFAQLVTERPIVATWGQRVLLRDESGVHTLGGAIVLRAVSSAWNARRPASLEGLAALRGGGPRERVEELVRGAGWDDVASAALAAGAGLADADEAQALRRQLGAQGRLRRLVAGAAEQSVHAGVVDAAADAIQKLLAQYLERHPRSPGVPRSEWPTWMPRACPKGLRAALADLLVDTRRFVDAAGYVLPAGHVGAMSPADQELLRAILREFRDAAFQPPRGDALTCITPRNAERVAELIELAAARGELVRIGQGLWLHGEHWGALVRKLHEQLLRRKALTVADIRDLLGSSRKIVVPLVEHLDAIGFTRRDGDLRRLGPRATGLLAQFQTTS